MSSFISNSRKCKLIYNDRKQINGWVGSGGIKKGEGEGQDYKGPKETLGVLDRFIFFMVVMIPMEYSYVKTLNCSV